MLIDYDKTFPEAARSLALDGAQLVACLSAWPTSITKPGAADGAGPAGPALRPLRPGPRGGEPRSLLASSNQTGALGGMRFLGQAKVVGPGGDILARTWSKAGWPSRSWTSPPRSPGRAGSSITCPSASRARTGDGSPVKIALPHLLHQAARRRGAHPRARRGPGGGRAGRDRMDPGAGGGTAGFFRPVDPSVRLRVVAVLGRRAVRGRRGTDPALDRRPAGYLHAAPATTSCTAQDCISANAVDHCLRTVHHLDHFTTP